MSARKRGGVPLAIQYIRPMNEAQEEIFESYADGQNLFIHGVAGTGKTFIALYLALKDVVEEKSDHDRVIVYRSVVPTREIGFLPGGEGEKCKPFEAPYEGICAKLFNKEDAYELLKSRKKFFFETTSHIRGITIDNAIIIVDEAQNLSWHEIASLITRMGENSRIIFCGDYRQSDLPQYERGGIEKLTKVVLHMESFDSIEMTMDDIVRSGVVKEFIIAATEAGYL